MPIHQQEHSRVSSPTPDTDRLDGSLRVILDRILIDLTDIKESLAGQRKPYLTIAEVAHLVGRSEYTVRRWISEDRIKAIRIDGSGPRGRLLVPREELARLVEDGKGSNVPGAALGT